MIDTLQTVINSLENSSDKSIELLNKVDSFYNSAWNKLILVGTVAFGVIGILVPFVIQWYQKKSLKISEKLMKSEMETQTQLLKVELLEAINKSLVKKFKKVEEEFEKLSASANAKAFHLQANEQLKNGNVLDALADYIICAENYLVCEDFSNLITVLGIISDECLSSFSLEEIRALKLSDDCDLEELLEDLASKESNGVFNKTIREIRLKLSKLPEKIKDKS